MDEPAFNRTKQLLRAAGFAVDESLFAEEDYGSWFIYVRGVPRLGVVWDARQRWVHVRRESGLELHGTRAWSDEWIGKLSGDQTPERVVDQVSALRRETGV